MAQKALEGVVRELHKVVSELATKISALESKIDEQSTIIVKQEESLKLLTLAIEGTPKSAPPKLLDANDGQENPAIPATTQRPMRQARANSSAKAKIGYAAAAKKSAATKPRTDGDVGDVGVTNNLLKTSTVTATIANPTLPTKATLSSVDCQATNSAGTRTVDTGDNRRGNIASDEEWQPARKARNFKRRVVTGSGQEDDELKTVEKLKYLQAWSFKPETTEQNVLTYLNKLQDCDKYIVEKRLIKTTRHAAFVIAFPESLNETINTPTAWPTGVKLSDWFPRRPRGQRGDTSSETHTGDSARAVVGCSQ